MTTSRTRKAAPSSATKKSASAAATAGTKKSSTKKASATGAPAKKSRGSTAKATAKRSPADDADETESTAPRKRASAPRAAARPKPKAAQIAREAATQLRELTGKDVEGITGFTATDDGWSVEVEVVEVRRIPNTTDVLALYEVTVDESGAMEGYRRLRRYARGVAREG